MLFWRLAPGLADAPRYGAIRSGECFWQRAPRSFCPCFYQLLFSTQPAVSFAGTNWRRFGLIPQAAAISFVVMFAGYVTVHRDGVRALLRVVVLAV